MGTEGIAVDYQQEADAMLSSVEGVYRDGKIELAELPGDVRDETPVIVTFIRSGGVDLRSRGIDTSAAVRLRAGLRTFAEDWESPEIDIYDDYDTARAAGSS